MIGETPKAEQILKDYIIEYPEDPYGMIDLAVVYWNNGKRDKSLLIFKDIRNKVYIHRTFEIGKYCDKKIQSIAIEELNRLHSFVHKCEIPNGFYEDTEQLEIICGIRPLAYRSEIHGVEIPEWMNELSFVTWRESHILRSFASWLNTKDNKVAIESAFQLDHEIKTLEEFRVIAVSWATACRRNNLLEASREADQLRSDIDERCEIQMKKSEKK
jgi:hypothetical protein